MGVLEVFTSRENSLKGKTPKTEKQFLNFFSVSAPLESCSMKMELVLVHARNQSSNSRKSTLQILCKKAKSLKVKTFKNSNGLGQTVLLKVLTSRLFNKIKAFYSQHLLRKDSLFQCLVPN